MAPAFYLSIIAWEIITTLLCWWGGLQLVRALRA
jgi:predicted small integral membrane protein